MYFFTHFSKQDIYTSIARTFSVRKKLTSLVVSSIRQKCRRNVDFYCYAARILCVVRCYHKHEANMQICHTRIGEEWLRWGVETTRFSHPVITSQSHFEHHSLHARKNESSSSKINEMRTVCFFSAKGNSLRCV